MSPNQKKNYDRLVNEEGSAHLAFDPHYTKILYIYYCNIHLFRFRYKIKFK